MECFSDKFKLVSKVGPQCDPKLLETWLKILEFTSQVWINCEHQINLYSQPCGSLLAEIAEKLKKAKVSYKLTFSYPASIFYSLGIEFGRHIDSLDNGKISAGLAVLFIKWGAFLENEEVLSYKSFTSGYSESLNYVEKLGWSDPMYYGLKAVQVSIQNSCQRQLDPSEILEHAADSAENAALQSLNDDKNMKVDAGAHVVGITARAVYQAYKISQ